MTGIKRILMLANIWLAVVQLAACGQVNSTPIPSVKITSTLPPPIPTETVIRPTLAPATSLSVSTALDRLRMAYIVEGSLYIQEGRNSPIRLTYSNGDSTPIFSYDGEKIVFIRRNSNNNLDIYSINKDGSQEKAVITDDWLITLGEGTKVGSVDFVPNSHQLLFNTYFCSKDLSLGCSTGVFLADVETSEIMEILSPTLGGHLPFSGSLPWGGNFKVSPDGKLIAIAFSGHISLFNIDGQSVQNNIVSYGRTTPIELFPRMFWLPDSSSLIVAMPAENHYGRGYETMPSYTVWRYLINSKVAAQIDLDPPPMWVHMECSDIINLSPDGNWAIYNYLADNSQLYLGNLNEATTQSFPLEQDCSPAYWSSDNVHFVYGRLNGSYLGAVDKPLIRINGGFLGWLDSIHFIYTDYSNERNLLLGKVDKETVATYDTKIYLHEGYYRYSLVFFIPNK